jgi:4-amino-4-deoxy-L-arabinose transferase-like glycosyltransferase
MAVAAITLGGLALRAWNLPSVGLEHADEGVYALSALGLSERALGGLYERQVYFSPPLFVTLLAASYRLLGASDVAAILVNIIFGTLTIPAVWAVGRAWFGAPAGIASAVLVALNASHITFSRSALTDIVFAFLFLCALAATTAALERRNTSTFILAGILIGLAWNTKYHGWMVVPIAGLALLARGLFRRDVGAPREQWLGWLGISALALALYVPWFLYVERRIGSYGLLLDFQRNIIERDWLRNLWRHVEMQRFLDGGLGRPSLLLAALCVMWTARAIVPPRRFITWLVLALIGSWRLGAWSMTVLFAMYSIPPLLRGADGLGRWTAAAWFVTWIAAAPLWYPLARLALPFSISACLLAGAGLRLFLLPAEATGAARAMRLYMLAAAAAALILVLVPRATADPWRSSRSMADAAARFMTQIPAGAPIVVEGEPCLAFYLHAAGRRPAWSFAEHTLELLTSTPAPAYVIAGRGAHERRYTEAAARLGRLEPLDSVQAVPKDIRLLDDDTPEAVRRFRREPDERYALTLFRFTPQSVESRVRDHPTVR